MMDEITLRALNTFTKNLKYLEEHHKPIFEKIALLNHLIDEGQYTEHYALEYKDEGYFDILEIATNEFLYKSNSLEAAQRMVDVIDFKRTGAIFKGQKYVYATEEQADRIDNSELSFHNSLWGTIKIINYVSKFAPAESFMNRVHKVIFLGIGLEITEYFIPVSHSMDEWMFKFYILIPWFFEEDTRYTSLRKIIDIFYCIIDHECYSILETCMGLGTSITREMIHKNNIF